MNNSLRLFKPCNRVVIYPGCALAFVKRQLAEALQLDHYTVKSHCSIGFDQWTGSVLTSAHFYFSPEHMNNSLWCKESCHRYSRHGETLNGVSDIWPQHQAKGGVLPTNLQGTTACFHMKVDRAAPPAFREFLPTTTVLVRAHTITARLALPLLTTWTRLSLWGFMLLRYFTKTWV